MKTAFLAFIAPLVAFAQLGADRSIVAESVSNVHTNYSWKKDVVAEDEYDKLIDRQRVLASAARVAAEAETVSGMERLATSWKNGFSNGVETLSASLSNVPRTGRFICLKFPLIPQTSRKFDIYVASNYYDSASNEDIMFVHFGQSFTNQPSMVVPYVWESGMTTQRVAATWIKSGTSDNWTNTYDIVQGRSGEQDIHYTCHKLHCKRPTAIKDVPCNLNPHGVWGGPDGMNFGSYLLNVIDGDNVYPAYTGSVTNQEAGVVAVFDNGALKEIVEIQQGENE